MIFRKLLKRNSSVIIGIEADNKQEANKIFEEWYNNDDNIENTSQLLSEREKDSEEWLISFPNWETYNRSGFDCADFIIEKKDDEPRYDGCIISTNKFSNIVVIAYKAKMTLTELMKWLSAYNYDYKLKPVDAYLCNATNDLDPMEVYKKEAAKNNSKLVVFDIIGRREDK